jgi:hypothetical protein
LQAAKREEAKSNRLKEGLVAVENAVIQLVRHRNRRDKLERGLNRAEKELKEVVDQKVLKLPFVPPPLPDSDLNPNREQSSSQPVPLATQATVRAQELLSYIYPKVALREVVVDIEDTPEQVVRLRDSIRSVLGERAGDDGFAAIVLSMHASLGTDDTVRELVQDPRLTTIAPLITKGVWKQACTSFKEELKLSETRKRERVRFSPEEGPETEKPAEKKKKTEHALKALIKQSSECSTPSDLSISL